MKYCELGKKNCIAVQTHYLNYLNRPVCVVQALSVGKHYVISEMKNCPSVPQPPPLREVKEGVIPGKPSVIGKLISKLKGRALNG